jgi:hypothetical protein
MRRKPQNSKFCPQPSGSNGHLRTGAPGLSEADARSRAAAARSFASAFKLREALASLLYGQLTSARPPEAKILKAIERHFPRPRRIRNLSGNRHPQIKELPVIGSGAASRRTQPSLSGRSRSSLRDCSHRARWPVFACANARPVEACSSIPARITLVDGAT